MSTVADLDRTFNDFLIYLWGRSYCVICVDNWYYIKADQFRQGAEEIPARLLVVEIRFCHQHLCVWKGICTNGRNRLKSLYKPKVSRIWNWHLLILCIAETQTVSDVIWLWIMWKLCETPLTCVHRTWAGYCRCIRDVKAAREKRGKQDRREKKGFNGGK